MLKLLDWLARLCFDSESFILSCELYLNILCRSLSLSFPYKDLLSLWFEIFVNYVWCFVYIETRLIKPISWIKLAYIRHVSMFLSPYYIRVQHELWANIAKYTDRMDLKRLIVFTKILLRKWSIFAVAHSDGNVHKKSSE